LARTLYEYVLYRGLATRYRIEEVRALKELAFYLVSNPASLISFNKLKDQLRLGSVNTVKRHIEYLENSWLLFTANVYDFSVKRQQVAPKKVHVIDAGLANAVGFSFSPNTGKLLENLVFLALRRQTREIYCYRSPGGLEVDFYLPETRQLIQVSQSLAQTATRGREVRALTDAMRSLGLVHGLILAEANEAPVSVNGMTIAVRSLAEWLLAEGGESRRRPP
jgi:predicted AAA+ superfamily ATPase